MVKQGEGSEIWRGEKSKERSIVCTGHRMYIEAQLKLIALADNHLSRLL